MSEPTPIDVDTTAADQALEQLLADHDTAVANDTAAHRAHLADLAPRLTNRAGSLGLA